MIVEPLIVTVDELSVEMVPVLATFESLMFSVPPPVASSVPAFVSQDAGDLERPGRDVGVDSGLGLVLERS